MAVREIQQPFFIIFIYVELFHKKQFFEKHCYWST